MRFSEVKPQRKVKLTLDSQLLTQKEVDSEIQKGFQMSVEDLPQDLLELISREYKSDKFAQYLLRFQKEDVALDHIRQCKEGKHPWPKDFESIRTRLLTLFGKLKIGKDIEDKDVLFKMQMTLIYLFRKEDKIFIKDSVLMMNDPELRNDLFIIPLAIQKELINLLHSRSGALHLGINKTQIIAQQYLSFWNMTNVIAEVVGSCKQCKDGKKN